MLPCFYRRSAGSTAPHVTLVELLFCLASVAVTVRLPCRSPGQNIAGRFDHSSAKKQSTTAVISRRYLIRAGWPNLILPMITRVQGSIVMAANRRTHPSGAAVCHDFLMTDKIEWHYTVSHTVSVSFRPEGQASKGPKRGLQVIFGCVFSVRPKTLDINLMSFFFYGSSASD